MSKKLDENGKLVAGILPPDPFAGAVKILPKVETILTLGDDEATAVSPGRNRGAGLVLLSEVAAESVEYVWPPQIPRRKLTLLEGDPAAGKTWLAIAISAHVTRGWSFKAADGRDHPPAEPAPVLYASAEDGPGDTLRPRFEKAGADLNLVHVLVDWRIEEKGKPPVNGVVTLKDLDVLEDAFQRVHPSLFVIDPLQGYLGAETDMNRANEVRPVLTGLCKLAERYACAVLAIRHMTKGTTSRSLYRGMGSIDFTAAARSVLLAGKDPNSGQRALVHLKSSLAPNGPSVGYSLENGFEWTGVSDLTDRDLVAAEDLDERRRGSVEDAVAFLLEELGPGPVRVKAVEADAKEQGISERTLNRARKQLGIRSYREPQPGQQKGAPKGHWLLALPDTMTQGANLETQGANPQGPPWHPGHPCPGSQEISGGEPDGQF